MEAKKVLENLGMHNGCMISGSKSGYIMQYPDNEVVFNANIATKALGKFWYGDVDLTKSKDSLISAAKDIGEDLYIFYEMDYRFENEDLDLDTAIKKCYTYFKVSAGEINKVSK